MTPAVDHHDVARRSWSALVWSYAGAIGRSLAQVVVNLLLARLLGPESFGLATAAFFVFSFGWLLSEGGFGSALVQKKDLEERDVSYALGWILLVSGSFGVFVLVAAPWLAALLGNPALTPLIRVCGPLIPLQAVSNISVSLMRRNLDMKRAQAIQVSGYLLAYGGVGLACAWSGAGAWSLIAAYTSYCLITFGGCYAIVRHTWRPTLTGDPKMRAFGLRILGSTMATWAIENLDRIVISRYWGTVHLGEYAAASNLARAPVSLMVSSLQSVSFASASRLQEDRARIGQGYLGVLGIAALVLLPSFGFLAWHADLIIRVIYGGRWESAAPLFAAFCVAAPFLAALTFTSSMLWAIGAVGADMRAQIVCAALLLAGFAMLAGVPLHLAVWLVPIVYGLRFLLVYRALVRQVGLGHATVLLQLRGAGIATSLMVLWGVVALQVTPHPWARVGLHGALTALSAAILLRAGPRLMLPVGLCDRLVVMARTSVWARRACVLIGLRAE